MCVSFPLSNEPCAKGPQQYVPLLGLDGGSHMPPSSEKMKEQVWHIALHDPVKQQSRVVSLILVAFCSPDRRPPPLRKPAWSTGGDPIPLYTLAYWAQFVCLFFSGHSLVTHRNNVIRVFL